MTAPNEREEREAAYRVPAARHRVEETVRGSRFITTLARTPDPEAAAAFVQEIRSELPDATHHCWAYVAGPAGDTAHIGLSDDGEPHGTAGRPILETLLHSGTGEVTAVVTRYFGGTKLGRGGLGRAYAGGAKRALETLPVEWKVPRERVVVELDYPALDPVLRFLAEEDARQEDAEYGAAVRIRTAVPTAALDRLERLVAELTGGRGTVTRLD